MTPEGEVPADNPVGGSLVFASGIRNSFGVCIDPSSGEVWETENGPDRDDEINRIPPGANLGWPLQLGPGGAPRFVDPVLTFERVIVPTGCAVTADGDVYFGDIGGNLHRVVVGSDGVVDEIVARLPVGIIDVAIGRGARLLVATTDTIYRQSGAADTSPSAPTSPPSPTPVPAAEAAGSPGWWLVPAAAAIGVAAIALVVASRRRSAGRRDGSPT